MNTFFIKEQWLISYIGNWNKPRSKTKPNTNYLYLNILFFKFHPKTLSQYIKRNLYVHCKNKNSVCHNLVLLENNCLKRSYWRFSLLTAWLRFTEYQSNFKTQNKSSHQRCSIKIGVLKIFCKIHRKTPMPDSLF